MSFEWFVLSQVRGERDASTSVMSLICSGAASTSCVWRYAVYILRLVSLNQRGSAAK